jgi:uncharacterized phiE125 gp8 family phage protein
MITPSIVEPAVSLAEAQAFVRVETGEEEALLAGLIRTATAVCEAFVNQALIEREVIETVAGSCQWQRLASAPVRSIELVETIGEDGSFSPLGAGRYAVDIDPSGDGWVRLTDPSWSGRLRVHCSAGMAGNPNELPEPIRQGVLRLVGHLFAARDGTGGEPPAAVTALWRPYRRMRLA